jgi:hypothetical protein
MGKNVVIQRSVFLAAGVAALMAAGCGGGGSAPSAPSGVSRPTTAAPAAFGTPLGAPVLAAPGFAAGDIGRCFQFRSEPACLSGARPRTGPVAGAVAPGAPGGFTATSNGSTVTLRWTAPTAGDPVTSYVIEAGSGSGAANLANFSTGNTQTTFTTTGVPDGAYYVRVRASNSTGTSAASNEVVLVVGPVCSVPPGEPISFSLVSNGGGTVSFSWTPGAYIATTYVIEAGSAPGLSNLAISDLSSVATTFTTTGVGRGIYYVRVRGRNACGTGLPSNEVILGVGTLLLDSTVSIAPGLTCVTTSASSSFSGTAGQTVVINVTGAVNSYPALTLYAPDFGTQLGGAGGSSGSTSLRVTLSQTGTHYASVCDGRGVGGTYRMVVTAQ